jgi:transposase
MPVFSGGQTETILAWDSTSHGGKMPEGYLHLTCEQRCQIYALLQSGHSQAHIARQIGVDPSTISRELVRNTGARGYRFKQAHHKASQRRKEASNRPRKMTPDLVELIEEKLTQEQWSPDQISGRLAKERVAFISHERIYQHVWKDKKHGGTLYLHLRHSGKKYNKRKGTNSGRGLIPNRVDIDQRPAIVAAKSRIGDWEADTIIGANHKGAVSRTSSDTQNTPNSPSCPTRAQTPSSRPARACFCRLLIESKRSLTTTEKSSPLTSKSQPRWGRYPILPNPITRGNAASTNTPTASSGSTSQKVQTFLFCPMPRFNGSRTNSTLAPEGYSATKPLARFSSAPKICPLHFTVEWAN